VYAVARLNSFDPTKLAAAGDALEQFDQAHVQHNFTTLPERVSDGEHGKTTITFLRRGVEPATHALGNVSLMDPRSGGRSRLDP